jgi:hypothetical protein
MGIELVKCTSCGKVLGLVSDIPRWSDEAQDTGHEPSQTEEACGSAGESEAGCFDICAACITQIEMNFRRQDMSGKGTLAEVLIGHFATFTAALQESRDSDIREVFPDLPRDILPRRRRWKRQQGVVKGILSRIGKPVCWYDPGLARDQQGPFWLFQLHHESGQVCHAIVDFFDVAELGDCVNALDYAPDGTPLQLVYE